MNMPHTPSSLADGLVTVVVSIMAAHIGIRYGGYPPLFPESAQFPLILKGDSFENVRGKHAIAGTREPACPLKRLITVK